VYLEAPVLNAHPRSHRALCATLSAALLLAPMSVVAQAKPNKAEMLKLSAEGEAAYAKKQFREAASLFERAWAAMPDPILRKNQMIAWFQIYTSEQQSGALPPALREACDNTVRFGEMFVVESNQRGELKLEDQNLAHKLMVQCHQDMAELSIKEDGFPDAEAHLTAAAALGLKDETLTRNDALRARIVERREELARAAAPVEEPVAPELPEPEPVESNATLAWVLVGVGAAGLITAGGARFYGASVRDDFYKDNFDEAASFDSYDCDASKNGRTTCLDQAEEMKSSVLTSEIIMGIGLGVGLAALIGGGALLIMEDDGDEAEPPDTVQTRLIPSVGPGSAGLVFEARF
jgi:hypothetical protein